MGWTPGSSVASVGVLWWRRAVPLMAGLAVIGNVLLSSPAHQGSAALADAPTTLPAAPPAVVDVPPAAAPVPSLQALPPDLPLVSVPLEVAPEGSVISVDPGSGTAQVLPWFDSPYLGHTGSRDGIGNTAEGTPKTTDLDAEKAMGLHWTFMEAYWAKFEPNGPTDYKHDDGGAWKSFDAFMVLAHDRQLYPLIMIAVGGNAGAPPTWAGERTSGDSAPANMQALVDFAGKMVARYKPGGTLAREKGWGEHYGARAWEMDNEPMNYETHWGNTVCDYSEFVTKTARRIKAIDPQALVLSPASEHPTNADAQAFLRQALDPRCSTSSDAFKKNGVQYTIGRATDVVSFHLYEEMDAAFDDSTLESNYRAIKGIFDDPKYRNDKAFGYRTKTRYWCTECEDFIGGPADPREQTGARANWVIQFLTRGFAMGVERLTVMDAHISAPEKQSVALMTRLLPMPRGIVEVTQQLGVDPAQARVFRWTSPVDGHWTYVAWAVNGSVSGTTISVPVRAATPIEESRTGGAVIVRATAGKASLVLTGSPGYVMPPAMSPQYSEPVFLVDSAPR